MHRRTMLSTLFIVFLLVQVALPVALHLGRNHLIFLPSTTPHAEEGLAWFGPDVEASLLRIERPDGRRLAAYDVQPRPHPNPPAPVVLFFHGNAGNLALRAPLAEALAQGFETRVVLFDYSGYGGNPGSPSETEIEVDGLAAYDQLIAGGVPAKQIVLYGESLGGAVALAVAGQRPCAGVVLQSSFASLASMTRRLYPWLPLAAGLQRGSFPNTRRVAELAVPLLVVHGREDRIIPHAEGEKLQKAAAVGTELWTIDGAGHNDLFTVAGDRYLARLGERFRQWTTGHEP